MSIKSILVFGLIGAASLSLTGCVEGGSYYADNSYSGYYSQSDVFYGGYGNDGFYRDRGYSNHGRGRWNNQYGGRGNHSGYRGRIMMYGGGNGGYRSGGSDNQRGRVFLPGQGKAISEGR